MSVFLNLKLQSLHNPHVLRSQNHLFVSYEFMMHFVKQCEASKPPDISFHLFTPKLCSQLLLVCSSLPFSSYSKLIETNWLTRYITESKIQQLTTLRLIAVVLNDDIVLSWHTNIMPVNTWRIAETRVVCNVNVTVANFTQWHKPKGIDACLEDLQRRATTDKPTTSQLQ